tara:strand:+ start:62 stop:499 length:438 start_codon:yes stop_codon:yes gene_type:complete
MLKKINFIVTVFLIINFTNFLYAENNFFEEGKEKYNAKEYKSSKFLFQRSIVFDPKSAKSYLYLAKIFNFEKNKKEEEKNIDTVLLLEPTNEEAIYMLMNIELKKSNYLEVKKLAETFSKVCKDLCEKKDLIMDSLKNLEPKNES